MTDPQEPAADEPAMSDDAGEGEVAGDRPAISRRRLLVAGGFGGGLLLGGGAMRGLAGAAEPGGDAYRSGGNTTDHAEHGDDDLAALGVLREGYGHGPTPPRDLDADLIDALTFPPPPDGEPSGAIREYELPVSEHAWPIADGLALSPAWTYGGRLPGPVIRATEGDRLRLHVTNHTSDAHNLHLHGSHDPQMDGWEPIPAGGSFTYEVEARPFGLHPYHCHTPPLAEHVRRGLYGSMIVDPPEGREPALEVVLVLGGFDVDGDGRNELYAFNGICGLYDRHPIRVEVDQLVRVYLINMIEGEPVAGFHLHAQTFDVHRSGTSTTPHEHTDQVTLAQGDRAILEFRLPTRGRYMFHPHQHRFAERGAMGWFSAV